MKEESKSNWPHAPTHRLAEAGTYIVTAGTYNKQPFFSGEGRLKALHGGLLKYARKYSWQLEAWAVFPNHYHFIAHSPSGAGDGGESLSRFLADFHRSASAWINRLDKKSGRKVWHNFWETQLTFEQSYFSRLNYVHQNAVHRGIVPTADQYQWCSAKWFERTATAAQVKTVYSFKTDKLKVLDDF